jgi:hypothetical protein
MVKALLSTRSWDWSLVGERTFEESGECVPNALLALIGYAFCEPIEDMVHFQGVLI